jgi:CubicO group peptidase (beta-lactamase class C family)
MRRPSSWIRLSIADASNTRLNACVGLNSEVGIMIESATHKRSSRRTWHAIVGALVRAATMVSLPFVPRASAQGAPPAIVTGLPSVDSFAATEFAKDSLGSITTGVISRSQLAWTHSYGFADMKSHRLATRSPVYRIGSITKPFTAVMLMQLVEAGKVSLSDPVEKYLPEVKQIGSKPAGALPFTFLQLATMTAGLAREPRLAEGSFLTGQVADWDKILLAALPHTDYISFPGTEFSYSNIGYAILGAALTRAAGVPYTEWERTRVLTPLGMTRTRFEIDPSIAADLATGYEVKRDGSLDDQPAATDARDGRGYKVPNGAIFTTVDDLSRVDSRGAGTVARSPATSRRCTSIARPNWAWCSFEMSREGRSSRIAWRSTFSSGWSTRGMLIGPQPWPGESRIEPPRPGARPQCAGSSRSCGPGNRTTISTVRVSPK